MKKTRRKSRALALQGLYQWKLTGYPVEIIEQQLRQSRQLQNTDEDFFVALLRGTVAEAETLDRQLSPMLDRPLAELSPIEHAILLQAGYELQHHPEIPYRVVINEAIELAKSFGGVEGYRYINGVLDKLATVLRADEISSGTVKKALH